MRSIKEILASATPEMIEKLKSIVEENDDIRLKEYLDTLLAPVEKKKVESKVKKPSRTIKITAGNKVIAFFNINDYDWVRYKGKKTKNIPYAGMILKLEPEDVYGVARIVDSYGKYKVIIPTYKKQVITLDKDIVDLIKARSKSFGGNIALIFKSTAEKNPEKL